MRRLFILSAFAALFALSGYAQKYALVDMEYVLKIFRSMKWPTNS